MTVAQELGIEVQTLQNMSGHIGEVPLKELRFSSPSSQNDGAKAKVLRMLAERHLAGCVVPRYVCLWPVELRRNHPCACTCHLCIATEIQE